jgi:hypothetical protein
LISLEMVVKSEGPKILLIVVRNCDTYLATLWNRMKQPTMSSEVLQSLKMLKLTTDFYKMVQFIQHLLTGI